MTNLRKLPSGDAVTNTETGETVKCDLDAPQNRRAWMAWAATLPPLGPVVRPDAMDEEVECNRSHVGWLTMLRARLGAKVRESTYEAVERLLAERDALRGELAEANKALTNIREELAERRAEDAVDGATIRDLKAQIIEATKATAKACKKQNAASRTATLELDRLRGELSALRAQREKVPAGLVADAKTLAARWSHLRDDNAVESLLLVRRLAACEPAEMLTVDDAIEAVHSMKERALGLDIVTVVNAEDALRKAAKS